MDKEFVIFMKPFEQKRNEFESDDHLIYFRNPTCKALLQSEILNVLIDNENTILVPGQGKVPYSLTAGQYCEELAHPHLFP